MYSSSEDSDRYSNMILERAGAGDDSSSIPVSNSANKEETMLLNYEHEYDDYAKDVIGKNLDADDTISTFSDMHQLSTKKRKR